MKCREVHVHKIAGTESTILHFALIATPAVTTATGAAAAQLAAVGERLILG